ncbi:phosphoribosylanthranilate isomerase [Flavobacterium cyclinae]|uniref:phosphoribosylanthranilate isomerase n=1 Tax=Flavobacterium cyclinae TaxID=2895947 RepID=UPI001E4F95FD|nr:phosphoribosylanthranilate isomerase [Flavobacterium cyclinae]UGS20229.1 phosphoribosylanthranilate isomerase [Flavobacterium cyclinae]
MKNIKLKICGMKDSENIMEISALQPDYLGFIFWEKSKRNMTLDVIPELLETTKRVGVFVNASIQEIASKINQYQLDIIQLHGNESVIFCKNVKKLGVEVIKVFSMDSNFNFSVVKDYVLAVDYFLFDTKGKLPGGNGITFDWNVLENYHFNVPYFLSGGIGTTEIDGLKEFLKSPGAKKCYAIDVNSRFEKKPGIKNKIKLQKFKKLLYEI